MRTLHVLVFGNDRHINDYDFSRIDQLRSGDRNIITVGINRIWRRYWPDYLVFMDADVINELIDNSITPPPHTTLVTSAFLFDNPDRHLSEEEHKAFTEYLDSVPCKVKMLERPIAYTKRKSSLLWSIVYMDKYLFPKDKCTFYLYGTSLRADVGHFWSQSDNTVQYDKDSKVVDGQYRSHAAGLRELRKDGFHIVSLTQGSRASEFLETIDLGPKALIARLCRKEAPL